METNRQERGLYPTWGYSDEGTGRKDEYQGELGDMERKIARMPCPPWVLAQHGHPDPWKTGRTVARMPSHLGSRSAWVAQKPGQTDNSGVFALGRPPSPNSLPSMGTPKSKQGKPNPGCGSAPARTTSIEEACGSAYVLTGSMLSVPVLFMLHRESASWEHHPFIQYGITWAVN